MSTKIGLLLDDEIDTDELANRGQWKAGEEETEAARRPLPDPSEVPDLFINLGLRPLRRSYREVDDGGILCGCCALTAVYITRVPSGLESVKNRDFMVRSSPRYITKQLAITEEFEDGASTGFDGDEIDEYEDPAPDYLAGHAWGKAAWQACFDAGLMDDAADATDVTSVIDLQAIDDVG